MEQGCPFMFAAQTLHFSASASAEQKCSCKEPAVPFWKGFCLFGIFCCFLGFFCVSVLFASQFMVHPFPLLTHADLPLATWQKGSWISIFPALRSGSERRQGGIARLSSIFSTIGDVCRAPPALQGGGDAGKPCSSAEEGELQSLGFVFIF